MDDKLPLANALITLLEVCLSKTFKTPILAQRHLPVPEASYYLVIFKNWQR